MICLFVCGFKSHSRKFHSYGDVTIIGEELQIMTYSQHLWPLSSEDSLACHTFCVLWASVHNGHLRGPVTLTPIAESLAVELSLPVFFNCYYCGSDSYTQPSTCEAIALTDCITAAVNCLI